MKKSIYKSNEEIAEILIDTYGEIIYKLAFLYLGNQNMADEIFQAVFYKAMKNPSRFQQENNEKNWLIRTTIQACKKLINPNLYKEIEAESQVNGHLYPLLMQLPSKYREVMVLSYYVNLADVEIAAILRIAQSSIPRYLFKGEQTLQKIIEERGDDDETSN